MKKLEKIHQQEQKTREKISALQLLLRDIDGQRTEQENLQIVQKFRGLKLSREELYAFLGGGELPPALAGILGGTADETESIYSQNNRKRNNRRENTHGNTQDNMQDSKNTDSTGTTTHFESEGLNHEE